MGLTSIYDERQNIFELQSMLREIAKFTEGIGMINPDGLFLRETAGAVTDFQKFSGIEPTGEVDLNTWKAIVDRFRGTQN